MPGKRHHYVPRFHLRRFTIDPSDKRSQLWRLDRQTGTPRRVSVNNEAVQSRYYRIVDDDGTVDDSADELLDRIEDRAAPIVASLAEPGAEPGSEGLMWLSLYLITLKQRTPEGRHQLREIDNAIGRLWLEAGLSDRKAMAEILTEARPRDIGVETEQKRLLDDLRAGRFGVESTPSREVALMFMSLEEGAEALTTRIGWTLARASEGSSFVLSDHPVTHHDPTPKFPGAGAGFLSSDHSLTFVALDQRYALILQPFETVAWREIELKPADVDDLNLIGYAWADAAIYGCSQEVVARVRRRAKKDKAAVARFAKQPPRIWTAEIHDESSGAGARTFTSTVHGETITRRLYVSQEGVEEARRRAFSLD